MDRLHYEEMKANLDELVKEGSIRNKKIYLFGHCNATEELADELLNRGYEVTAILDNNIVKHGNVYCGIPIQAPKEVLKEKAQDAIVCIVARAYAAMKLQLEQIGYQGVVRKLVEYNSYADYSLSVETCSRMILRRRRGECLLSDMNQKFPGHFKILCPFSALGDIYFMMSYLPYFLQRRKISRCVVCVIGRACEQVVSLFAMKGGSEPYPVMVCDQKDMDELIQACLYTENENFYVPHQDRPYVIGLHKALHIKCIPLEQIYCSGVFGLPVNTKPAVPTRFCEYKELDQIREGKAVIFSPYAKSVTAISWEVWKRLVDSYRKKGYQCFTNVVGEEKALPETQPISPKITEMKSIVERAGTFIGIRSGMCDVVREAKAKKIALYPDYCYADTKWKAIDMYAINGWDNRVVEEGVWWE